MLWTVSLFQGSQASGSQTETTAPAHCSVSEFLTEWACGLRPAAWLLLRTAKEMRKTESRLNFHPLTLLVSEPRNSKCIPPNMTRETENAVPHVLQPFTAVCSSCTVPIRCYSSCCIGDHIKWHAYYVRHDLYLLLHHTIWCKWRTITKNYEPFLKEHIRCEISPNILHFLSCVFKFLYWK